MSQLIKNKVRVKPFLRWAGGKRWLTKSFTNYLPTRFRNYHEPFLGGASIFLHLKSNGLINGKSYLSDFNPDLINCYEQIQNQVEDVISELKNLKNTQKDYYKIRGQKPESNILKAAQFIYLNKTSFNGIYRVNLKGEYNVPYGFKKTKDLFEFDNMRSINNILNNNVQFLSNDFYSSIQNIQKGDLVFLDPPYTVAHENNGFIKYNQKIFQWNDQQRLAELVREIISRKAHYILTNAAHSSISDLFSSLGQKHIVERSSNIGGKGAARHKVNEYIFTNIQ